MKEIKEANSIPIKLWLDDLEDGAMEQAKHLSLLPFAFHHVSVMPDAHQGFGMPIGGVLATKDYVVPNAVGGDIGCGMNAVKTTIKVEEATYDKIKDVIECARKLIPVGFNVHNQIDESWINRLPSTENLPKDNCIEKEMQTSLKQLGTLGGGNHFIEIQAGSDGFIWLMLHSGSRHLGQVINNTYNGKAVKWNYDKFPEIDPKWDLAPLPISTGTEDDIIGKKYLSEMQYAVDYALANRKLMMENLQYSMKTVFPNAEFSEMINITHNFASLENHYGEDVYIHRKGATKAFQEEMGIIPGSQGTFSYIVKGKGNPESFKSCSHGAGRKLSRNKAQKLLSLSQQKKLMEGIVNDIKNVKDLDEAPGAYKDIKTVMNNQKDLVDIVVELRPLGVLKG